MTIAGVILAGGAGARIGTHKPLVPFRGAALIDAVIARARPQVERLALDVPGEMMDAYARYSDMTVLPDLYAETGGPLCGIVTGLAWLASLPDAQWLATFPCDTPFLPDDLVSQLAQAKRDGRPVVATHGGRVQSIFGLWSKSCFAALKSGVEAGTLRSVRSAVEAFDGIECAIAAPDHAFFNVNTREDLTAAEAFSPS